MKIPSNWRGRKKIDRVKRIRHKLKIRWDDLGLTDPADDRRALSMDEIRFQVLHLSSKGLGHAVRSRPGRDEADGAVAGPRRRGAD